MEKKTQEQFIQDALVVWGNRYDFSKVEYKNSCEKVTVICPKHGEFMTTPNNLLRGHGCKQCATEENVERTRKDTETFIKEAKKIHGDNYDYSLVDYVSNHSKVKIICPIHGVFEQKPNNHLNGAGCLKCKRSEIVDTESFVKKAKEVHGDNYDYSKVIYHRTDNKVEIICPIHGSFYQTPHAHLRGIGCPKCKASHGEKKIAEILDKYGVKYKTQYKFEDCKDKRALPFDFYLPEYNACIEYQGKQHYMLAPFIPDTIDKLKGRRSHDFIKREYCRKNNIALFEIRYNDDIEQILDTLFNMPKNYQSQESMDAMLTALGTALGFTFTKTWDGTKWTYVITANPTAWNTQQ